jgi:hypothetical protein
MTLKSLVDFEDLDPGPIACTANQCCRREISTVSHLVRCYAELHAADVQGLSLHLEGHLASCNTHSPVVAVSG